MLHSCELQVLHSVVSGRGRGCGKNGLLLRRFPLPGSEHAHGGAISVHMHPGKGGWVKTSLTKSLCVLLYGEIMRRDLVVLFLIFSMHLKGALRALVGFRQVSTLCWSQGGFLLDFVDVLFMDLSC